MGEGGRETELMIVNAREYCKFPAKSLDPKIRKICLDVLYKYCKYRHTTCLLPAGPAEEQNQSMYRIGSCICKVS